MNNPLKLITSALLLSVSILSADDMTDKLKDINRQLVEHNERLERLIDKLRKMFQDRESNTVHVYTNIIAPNWWETNQYTTNINPYWLTNNFKTNTVTQWTNWSYKINHILAMESDGSLTNTINLMVTSGKFCAVRGHTWGDHAHVTLEYTPNIVGCRQCQICGLHQSQHATDWK